MTDHGFDSTQHLHNSMGVSPKILMFDFFKIF